MSAAHRLCTLLLVAGCFVVARAWRRLGVTAEHDDRVGAIELHLTTGRLQAADQLARAFLADFDDEITARPLATCAIAARRAQLLLDDHHPAAARALLEPFAAKADAPAVVHALLGRARRQAAGGT